MVAMATYMKADWWTLTFLNGKYIKRNFTNRNSRLQAIFKTCCDLGEGGTLCPLAWIGLRGLKGTFSTKPQTKDTAQMALFLVFNEGTTAKTALSTYLKLTLNGIFVG